MPTDNYPSSPVQRTSVAATGTPFFRSSTRIFLYVPVGVKISALHHVFNGSGRRAEAGAEIRFLEELRQWVVLHGIRFQGGDGRYSATETILEKNVHKGVPASENGPANDPAI